MTTSALIPANFKHAKDIHSGIAVPLVEELIRPDRSAWTPDQLGDLTRTVAARLSVPLLDVLQFKDDQRWWTRLALTSGVELWLLSWAPGQGTEPHDHGGASGSFTVLLGELAEEYRYSGGSIETAVHRAGATVAFGPHRAHQLRSTQPAASVHAYSPPLRPVREYNSLTDFGGVGNVDELLTTARAGLVRVNPKQAAALQAAGTLLIDIRPHANRLAEGEIPGAVVIERIVLEWRLDPAGVHRLSGLAEDTPVIIFCNEGYASSLAADEARGLGLPRATDLIGGFRAWKAAGLPVIPGGTPAIP